MSVLTLFGIDIILIQYWWRDSNFLNGAQSLCFCGNRYWNQWTANLLSYIHFRLTCDLALYHISFAWINLTISNIQKDQSRDIRNQHCHLKKLNLRNNIFELKIKIRLQKCSQRFFIKIILSSNRIHFNDTLKRLESRFVRFYVAVHTWNTTFNEILKFQNHHIRLLIFTLRHIDSSWCLLYNNC